MCWVIQKWCFELLSIQFKAFWNGRKAKTLGGCLVFASFGLFWSILGELSRITKLWWKIFGIELDLVCIVVVGSEDFWAIPYSSFFVGSASCGDVLLVEVQFVFFMMACNTLLD
ncbi:hypothetical protein PRUPE_5G022500 [Prunus persica]|uniref:Transmembrane protein n=1 Tax=Prunus persica TaxID=3760 RepID=A0A251P2A8_PRUPE|nr:hypothetical protein PRUPE_5G022500 [Prunus persica]